MEGSELEVVDTLWYGGEAAYANVGKIERDESSS